MYCCAENNIFFPGDLTFISLITRRYKYIIMLQIISLLFLFLLFVIYGRLDIYTRTYVCSFCIQVSLCPPTNIVVGRQMQHTWKNEPSTKLYEQMRFLVLCDGFHMVSILQVMALKKSGQDQNEVDGSIPTACLSRQTDPLSYAIKIGGENAIFSCFVGIVSICI